MKLYKHKTWFLNEEHTREEFLQKCARCSSIYMITEKITKHNILVCEENRGSTILKDEEELRIYNKEKCKHY